MSITIFDTSIGSYNLGDIIIMDAVNREIFDLFPDAMLFRSCTHMKMGRETYKLALGSDFLFVGGTNLLSSRMLWNYQWRIDLIDSIFVNKLILLGVGWWQYQKQPDLYTKILLKRVLDKKIFHSVRDSYTENLLLQMGFVNVLNTGCPTLWSLDEEHCRQIPFSKSEHVLFTLTDYKQDPRLDALMISILRENYTTLYFWPQGLNDQRYLRSLGDVGDIKVVLPSVQGLDNILSDGLISLDYVGTRLHAGIRALQKGRRTIIIGIDNRAKEKSKDFNLTVVARENTQVLSEKINSSFETLVRLPKENIERWLAQFK